MGRFDALLKELGLAKSLDTAEDDQRIATAAGEDGEADGGEIHPEDAAVANMFRKVVEVVSALRRDVDEMRAELGTLKGRGGQPMTKALRLRNRAQEAGREFMAKAMIAQSAGRITSIQVATAEACINAGKAPPRDIIASVLG